MPEQTLIPTDDSPPVDQLETETETGGSSIFAKIKILLFVMLVIAAECFLAWLYLPSLSKTTSMVEASAAASPDQDKTKEPKDDLADWNELDLGEFNVVAYQLSGTTLRIDFHLYGMVHMDDEEEFLILMEDHLYRFREQIHFTIRSAEITDLTKDAGLGLIRRKILERTNKILGKSLLRRVIFDNFSLIEQ